MVGGENFFEAVQRTLGGLVDSQLKQLHNTNMSADASASAAAAAATPAAPFTTSFLRDGATGKSYVIIHFGENYAGVSYTVYERESPFAISTTSLSGSVTDSKGATFTFPTTKGSAYFVVVKAGDESLSWTVDPNKRRVVGASKKRAAEQTDASASAAADATPAAAAPVAAASAAAASEPKADKGEKAPKKKKSDKGASASVVVA